MKDSYRQVLADLFRGRLSEREKKCVYLGFSAVIFWYVIPLLLVLLTDLLIALTLSCAAGYLCIL